MEPVGSSSPVAAVPTGRMGARVVRTMNAMLSSLLVALPVALLATAGSDTLAETALLVGLTVAVVALWGLLRAGRHHGTAVGLVVVLIAFATATSAAYGSIRSVGALAFVGAAVVGGMFLGRGALAAALAGCGAGLGMVIWGESQGWFPRPDYRTTWVQWTVHMTVLTTIAVNLWFARKVLLDAMRRSDDSEQRFRRLFEASPSATVIYTLSEGRIVDCNPAYEALLGRPRAAVLGRTGAELGLWADPTARERLRARLEREGQVRNIELDLVAADGTVVRCLSNRSAIAVDGQACVLAQLVDVSAEQAARQAQRQSEERFSRIFRSNPAAMVITDYEDRVVVDMNDAAERMFGVTREQARGMPTLMSHEDPQAYEAQRASMLEAGATRNVPTSLHDIEGRVIEALISSELIEEDGRRYGINTLVDVTAESAARRAQEKSEDRFSKAFHSSPMAMAITRLADGCFVETNLAHEKTHGFARDELVGRRSRDFGAWQIPGEREAFLDRLHADGRVLGFDTRVRNKAGGIIDIRLWAERVEFDGEDCILVSSLNVTEQKRADERLEERVRERTAQLEALNRELETFAYSVSHDLRAPLRAIDGFTRLLSEELGAQLDAAQRATLGRVLANAARMNQLIEDLLGLSRVSRSVLRIEPVDLGVVASEIIDALREREPARRVEIELGRGLETRGDRGLLRIVLENLIGNAWKFTGRQDPARISVTRERGEDGEPVFVVRDNGAGFDMQYAAKLFAPFQRFHKVTEFEGTGVGLATVQRIVARHGGRIWAESAPGHGATFRFTLRANGERGAADVRHSA